MLYDTVSETNETSLSHAAATQRILPRVVGLAGALLVRPVAVLREVLAGGLLLIALPVAGRADAEEPVEEQQRQAGADAHREALVAGALGRRDQEHEARED